VLVQLEEAVAQLRCQGIAALIPEVQSNLGLALPGATIPSEVAAWEGRIVRVGMDIHPVGSPRFGASRHVATMILKAMRVDPRYRSAMNIRYGEDIQRACQAAKLRPKPLSGWWAASEALKAEGSPEARAGSEAMLATGTVPDVFYDLGAVGQEAMVWVLGQDASEVCRKVLQIGHSLNEP
jgi:hydroxymethylpyrimidine/phosphomethylpyrimidine kinase